MKGYDNMKINKPFDKVEKKEFLNKLYELWCLVPEQRFGQLIENFVNQKDTDFFYQEDSASWYIVDNQIDIIQKKQIDRKIVKMLENQETRDKIIDMLTDEGLL
jgi:capsular polysaccharide biosynthesis protein